MKVKNIMFSGVMAAILAGPALAADAVVATVASTGYVDAKVGVNATAIAENKAAIQQNATEIAKKANANDVYTKTEADLTFEKLGVAQAYTDKQLEDLLKDFGTAGDGESGGTGLQGTVASQGERIGSLEEKVGDTAVATQITNALNDLKTSNTYDAYGSAAQALTDAKGYTDSQVTALTTGGGAVAKNTADIAAINNADTGLLKQAKDYADGLAGGYETAGAAATAKSEAIAEAKTYTDTEVGKVDAKFANYTNTTDMNAAIKVVDDKFANYTNTTDMNAAIKVVDDKFANYTTTESLNTTLDTFATKTALKAEEDARIAADNVLNGKQDVLSGTGYVTVDQNTKTVSVTADGTIAADNTGLVTGGTVYTYALPKPTDCTEAKCVLSVDRNGAPYWMKLELAPVTGD